MSSYVQTSQAVLIPNASYTVSAADTGKLMLIGALTVGGKVISLPAPAVGLHYRFMATGTLGQTATLTPTPAGNIVNGSLIVDTGVAATTFIAKTAVPSAVLTATAVLGDYIDAYCDGTAWHVSGVSQAAAGLS